MSCINNNERDNVIKNKVVENDRAFNPWLASATYEEKDEYRFKGRSNDTHKIVSMLQQDDSVVCYAASGDGKSSLINAGVCPAIRRIGYFPIRITFSTDEFNGVGVPHKSDGSIDFDIFIAEKMQSAIDEYCIAFVREHNIADKDIMNISFEKIPIFADITIDNCLWWKLRSETIQLPYGEFDYIPVLIFDQFEEVFRAKWKADFFKWLEIFMKDIFPDSIAKKIGKKIDDITVKKLFKTIFLMRYEHIGELDYWCSQQYFIPQMIKNRYYLRSLNIEQASQIISKQPVGDSNALTVIKRNANDILSRLTEGGKDEVSAILLSIMCYTYYNQLLNDNKEELPSTRDLVARYYKNETKSINPEILLSIEKELVSEDKTRKRVRKKDIKNLSLIHSSSVEESITIGDVLLSRHLLRQYIINNEEYVELSHDKIAEVVKEDIDTTEVQRLKEEKEKLRIERNQEYNRLKYLNSLNVLTPKGRRLINNAIDFGEYRTIINSKTLYPHEYEILSIQRKFQNFLLEETFKEDVISGQTQKIIRDPLLADSSYRISFYDSYNSQQKICTIDGVYSMIIEYEDEHISNIFFYGKGYDEENGLTNFDTPICLNGGFYGIHLEYDEQGREIARVYLDKDKQPKKCIDDYARVETTYDSCGNPCQIRYFDYVGEEKIPCMHQNGNYGFNSFFDEAGNEILRLFVDNKNKPTKIVSGVEGKMMKYDLETFELLEIININHTQDKVQDIDGYVAVRYEYSLGLLRKELFLDINNMPWKNSQNICGNLLEYDLEDKKISNFFIENYIDNQYLLGKTSNGEYRLDVKYNNIQQVTQYTSFDENGTKCGEIAEMNFAYDDCGRITRVQMFDKYGLQHVGYNIEFNEEGNHIWRMWNIDKNGELTQDTTYGDEKVKVYGLEYIPQREGVFNLYFLNKYGQRINCSHNYFTQEQSYDLNKELVQELYFDHYGNLMQDTNGIYGVSYEKVNDYQTKYQYLDKDRKECETKDGVNYTIVDASSGSIFHYDRNGSIVEGIEVENILSGEGNMRILKYFVNNELEKYREETLDDKNRVIKSCHKNKCNEVILDPSGDFYTMKSYSEDGLTETISFRDNEYKECLGASGVRYYLYKYDSLGRIVEEYLLGEQKELIPFEDGSYGHRYLYERDKKTLIYLGKEGTPKNNNDKIAYIQITFDYKGREVLRRELTEDLGCKNESKAREYLKLENQLLSYYEYNVDENNKIISHIEYREEDASNRVIKCLYFEGKSTDLISPVCDIDGDYGYLVTYNEDNSITQTFLGEDGNPHVNKLGYASIQNWLDEVNRPIKKMYFSLDNSPCQVEGNYYGLTTEYLDDQHYIEGYLDKYGNITRSSNGFAYKEVKKEENKRYEYYYDENKICAIDNELGDYGKIYKHHNEKNDNIVIIESLGKDGSWHVNSKGYVVQIRKYDLDNRVQRIAYFNKQNESIYDEVGDYETYFEYLNENTTKIYSLNSNGEPHINDYGYVYEKRFTDTLYGEIFSFYYNKDGKQVLPKRTMKHYWHKITFNVQNFLRNRSYKGMQSFNARQIGATNELIIARQEQNGLAKKMGLKGVYIVIKINEQEMLHDIDYETVYTIMASFKEQSKSLVLLPVEVTDNSITKFSDLMTMNFPKGKLGFRFTRWLINADTYCQVIKQVIR